MCNACGYLCCASDEFEECGCDHCPEPACHFEPCNCGVANCRGDCRSIHSSEFLEEEARHG